MASTGKLIKLALNPFDFNARVERADALQLLVLSVVFGFAIGLPGVFFGVWLTGREESMYAPGQTYVTFRKYFFLPACWGLCGVFMGIYRATVAYWPWLDSTSGGAKATRMLFALVVLCCIGTVALFALFGSIH